MLGAVVPYRVPVRVDDRRGRSTSFALTVGVLSIDELWNHGFLGPRGPRSTLAGFVGVSVLLVALTAPTAALHGHERFSAGLLVPYRAWVLHDLA